MCSSDLSYKFSRFLCKCLLVFRNLISFPEGDGRSQFQCESQWHAANLWYVLPTCVFVAHLTTASTIPEILEALEAEMIVGGTLRQGSSARWDDQRQSAG